MSVKVTVDGKSYTGVDTVEVGGKSLTLAADVTAPSGTKTITANGSYDVTDFATAEVNVPTEGGASPVLQELTITENGTYTPAEGYDGFSQVVANIVTSGGGLTNISMGQKTPESASQLYIPVEEGKTPFLILTWSETAFESENVVCGHVAITNIWMLNGTKDVAGIILYRSAENGLQMATNNCFNKAEGSGYVEDKGYLMDRHNATQQMRTTDIFNYIVFYKPVGDLSFGGA